MISILRFLGTNCEFDMQYSCALANKPSVIVWHKETSLPPNTSLVIIPGGFSYGDYLRCGALARFAPIMKAVINFANNGGLVLGICNGFQILCEAGLLPGVLMRNKNINFLSKDCQLKISSNDNVLLKNYKQNEIINLPIAHAEGNYYIDEKGLLNLKKNNQIILSYVSDENGAIERIAGICNENKNVFGMMPHPERAIDIGSRDGFKMLEAIYNA